MQLNFKNSKRENMLDHHGWCCGCCQRHLSACTAGKTKFLLFLLTPHVSPGCGTADAVPSVSCSAQQQSTDAISRQDYVMPCRPALPALQVGEKLCELG